MKIYKATGHRHQPEIEHIIRRFIPDASISFTPTLAPTTRGILSNTHVFGEFDDVDLPAHYRSFYRGEKFVRIVEAAYTKNVAYSNYCDISIHYDGEKKRAVAVSAIDNLVKGAAGQAVQNMNLMFKYPETSGLNFLPYHP